MSDNHVTLRRRWFQISLSSLLWLMLVMALAATGIREHRQRVLRDAELASLKAEIKALKHRPTGWISAPKPKRTEIDKLLTDSLPQ